MISSKEKVHINVCVTNLRHAEYTVTYRENGGSVPLLFKKLLNKKLLGLMAAAAGAGILAALILPFWLLVIFESVFLIMLGFCYWK
jgi:hypothetical protein